MNRKCIYTAIFGRYEGLKEPKYHNKDFDYICFTDNKNLVSPIWDVRVIKDKFDNPRKMARHVKINYHEYLDPQYYMNIWMDGSIIQRASVVPYIGYCFQFGTDMAVIKHPENKCLYQEADVNILNKKSNAKIMGEQMEYYKKQRTPVNLPVIASGILVRKHTLRVKKLMIDWWDQVDRFTLRDQVSFSYVLWKNQMPVNYVDYQSTYKHYFTINRHTLRYDGQEREQFFISLKVV